MSHNTAAVASPIRVQPQRGESAFQKLNLLILNGSSPMSSDDPIAYFFTWTVYGTHLSGDDRGWRQRRHGYQEPQPKLAQWQRDRLTHPVILLYLSRPKVRRLAATPTACVRSTFCPRFLPRRWRWG